MRNLIFWGCALAGASLIPLIQAPAFAATTKGMTCAQLRDAEHALDKKAEVIRLRIQAATKGEGANVKAAREMIALLPGVYSGDKGRQLLDEARQMDEADAFIDADRVKPGQTATPDQKALAALQAQMAELNRAYNSNPDCEDRGEFGLTPPRP